MDALSHYHLSQEYAAKAGQIMERYEHDAHLREGVALAQLAQVHATLALAWVTALRGIHPDGEMPLVDANAWFEAVSQDAPIPPEADDEGKTWVSAGAVVVHTDCAGLDTANPDAVRVGSVSPTDAAELGEWLRALPLRTILRSHSWAPCQRGTGEEHIHRAPVREFPALFVYGDPFEITEGSERLDQLAKYHAPFTVLALGDSTQDGA